MAKGEKFVSLDTHFVVDPFVQTLNANDRWLYMVLICNPDISMIGVYELGLPTLELYSGLGREAVGHSLDRFAKANKIHYVDGWVVVKNHLKNNPIRGSKNLIIGAHKRLSQLPWSIRDRLSNPSDTLYIPYLDPTHDLFIGVVDPTDSPPTLSQSRAQARELGQNTRATDAGPGGRAARSAQPKKQHDPDSDAYWLDR